MTYSFEGQSAADNNTKFAINMLPTLLKKFVLYQFQHSKSIAVLNKISVPGKHCQELYCVVHELLGEKCGLFNLHVNMHGESICA